MNYEALSIDELAVRCKTGDKAAQAFAGERFAELVVQLEDEWTESYKQGYDEDVNQAAAALLEHELASMTPWYDVPLTSEYWRIG